MIWLGNCGMQMLNDESCTRWLLAEGCCRAAGLFNQCWACGAGPLYFCWKTDDEDVMRLASCERSLWSMLVTDGDTCFVGDDVLNC